MGRDADALLDRWAATIHRLAEGITLDADRAARVAREVLLALARADAPAPADEPTVLRLTVAACLVGAPAGDGTDSLGGPPTFGPDGHRTGTPAARTDDWADVSDEELVGGPGGRALARALAALSPRSRAALVLRDGEGVPAELVGELLGEPTPAVRDRVHRARLAVREVLARELAGARRRVAP